jgi:hypothetical protein
MSSPAPRPSRSSTSALVLAIGALLAPACRDASGSDPTSFGLVPNTAGANGCSGPDQVFTPPQAPLPVALGVLAIGPASHVTALADLPVLYATGAGATVVVINVTDPLAPNELELVGAGTVAALLADAGIADAPELGAIAVLDLERLLVVETTSNTILVVDRTTPDTVAFFAGEPDTSGGYADGLALGAQSVARFDLDRDSALCPTGAALNVLVADSQNHRLRWIRPQGDPAVLVVETLTGSGAAETIDGSLGLAAFDAPSGLSLSCAGLVIASERGGNRLRQIEVGPPSFFGGFTGEVTTIAGDGSDQTSAGLGILAQLSQPVSPLVTSEGEVYWIDSGTGVLRRRTPAGSADCPLFEDCASAVATPSFPAGNAFSLTATGAGVLFVLDATAGVLWRVTP